MAPAHFLPIASLANAIKGLAWMAGGSTRSSFNVAFAQNHNIGDVTAKATSQTICTSIFGTAAGEAGPAAASAADAARSHSLLLHRPTEGSHPRPAPAFVQAWAWPIC